MPATRPRRRCPSSGATAPRAPPPARRRRGAAEVRGGVAGAGPAVQRVCGHRAHRCVGALERRDGQAGRLGVNAHVRERFEGGGADLGTRVVRPSREHRARPAGAADRERLRVVDQVRVVDLRQLEQEVLALRPERRERGQPAGGVQRRVVQSHDDRGKRGDVAQVRQRVQRRGADVRMRIVERGDGRRACGRATGARPVREARPRGATTASCAGSGRRSG